MATNRLGLTRSIPTAVKRAVRKRCGFGCVVCGDAIIEYHHMTVGFAAASEHDEKKITLLCGACHSKVTRGIWSNAKIEDHNDNPYCIKNEGALTALDIGSDPPTIVFAGSEFRDCRIPVRIYDYPFVLLNPPDAPGSPASISAFFANSRGEPSLIISNNEILLRSENWDATASGKQFNIFESERSKNLTLTIEPRKSISVDRIESNMLGWGISGDLNSLRVTPPNGACTTYKGVSVAGTHVGFQLGTPGFASSAGVPGL